MMDQIFNGLNYSNTQCTMYSTAKGQQRVTNTEKGQEMTLIMSKYWNKQNTLILHNACT